MQKIISAVISTIIIIVAIGVIAYVYFIYQIGHNFVHEAPPATHSNAAPAESLPNRIEFPIHYTGLEFDTLSDKFFIQQPEYRLPDTIALPQPVECSCDCPGIVKTVYFSKQPREAYRFFFQHGDIKEGIIDVVFMHKNGQWTCSKSSYLDSSQQTRIRSRFQDEVLSVLAKMKSK